MSSTELKALDGLIATTIDSANGFEEAAAQTRAVGLANRFADFARDRWEIVEKLEDEARRLGGTPERSGTAKAAVHRRWLDLKNALMGSDHAVLGEVAHGETYIRTKFEAAIADGGFEAATIGVIEEGLSSIRRAREQVLGLQLTVGESEDARRTNVDWKKVGTGLGLAVALGGAAFAATRLAARRGAEPRRAPRIAPTNATARPAPASSMTTAHPGPRTGAEAATRSAGFAAASDQTPDDASFKSPGDGAGAGSFGSETTGSFGSPGSGGFDRR